LKNRIVVIDDEKNIGVVIEAMLQKAGFEPHIFQDAQAALHFLELEPAQVIITDLVMPGLGGMDVLNWCQKHCRQIPVIMITAFASVESAVAALKTGAFDFITKPFDQNELLTVVRKAVDTFLQRQKEPLAIEASRSEELPAESLGMIGSSPAMQEVFRMISKIAPSDSTVLLLGENGTGKELIAFEIHSRSHRASKPFIKINCAAIPASLIESELFGYEREAFEGAVSSKPGRFELANEGTLFLEEIGELPLEIQAKLLRMLQEQEFVRVGGVNTLRSNVRIIAANSRDLQAEVKAGRFREDLVYRLNGVPILLAPLRERRSDIEPLVHYFIQQFNQKFKKNIQRIEPDCLIALKNYGWPGNIRELENILERFVLMSDGDTLKREDLPSEIASALPPPTEDSEDLSRFKEVVRKKTQTLEKGLIERALEETHGNVTRAAEKLGLSRKGLQLKLKELGIKRGVEI
jgi:two-component system response regulator AtoC